MISGDKTHPLQIDVVYAFASLHYTQCAIAEKSIRRLRSQYPQKNHIGENQCGQIRYINIWNEKNARGGLEPPTFRL